MATQEMDDRDKRTSAMIHGSVFAVQQMQPQDAWSISPSSNGPAEACADCWPCWGQNSLRLHSHRAQPVTPMSPFAAP